jgi:hypothetical protein
MGSVLTPIAVPTYEFADLDTSGNTTDYLPVHNFRDHTIQFDVDGTSGFVTVRLEGSADVSANQWFALDTSSNAPGGTNGTGNVSFTAAGTYHLKLSGVRLEFIRLNFVQRSPALTGTIINIFYAGG